MRKDPTLEALSQLKALELRGAGVERVYELRPFLAHRSPYVVTRAVKIALEMELADLSPDLAKSCSRFLRDGAKTDPGCAVKIAILQALNRFGWEDIEVYLGAIDYVQLEGAYGSPEDRAATLRPLGAMGLVQNNHPEAMLRLANLLVDPWKLCRYGAAQVLGASGRAEAEALLRLKALCGDPEPEISGACLAGLLASWPQRSIAFVAKFLDSAAPDVAPEAANALGNARCPEAFAPLADRYDNRRLRPHIAMALAVLKTDEALEFLLARLKVRDPDARRALEIYLNDENIWHRVRAVSHHAK